MGHPNDSPYHIRPFRRRDRQAVRDICVATNWMGRYRSDIAPDDWLWAEYWTRYFTDRQPRLSWVAVRPADGRVVGYLTGTADVREFDAYAPYLLGGIIWRVIRKRLISNARSRRPLLALARSAIKGEMAVPDSLLRQYPATWHFNLLPEARRRGLGTRMLTRFIDAARQAGAPGLHAQVINLNAASLASCRRAGLARLHSAPLTAFAHVESQPMQLQTWGMRLQ